MYENDKNLKFIGKDIPRKDTLAKITGEAMYTTDMVLPGMLHALVKVSPYASAKILSLDTSKAEALPGVRGVLTGAELDYKIGLYLVDKDVLAKKFVRHYGEGVAAVVADDLKIAQNAIDLIEVKYEPMKPVLNVKDALKKDAPVIHPDLGSYDYFEPCFTPKPGTNIANHTKTRKGDVEKAFANSDYIVEREYTNPAVQHVPMETHAAIVQWKVDNNIQIWSSAQSAFTVRNLMANSFKLPHSKIKVTIPNVGGGFGGKAGVGIEPLVACLSRKAGGRPVKFVASREEEFYMLPRRTGLVYNIKTGLSKEGKILGQKMSLYWDAGAYADYAVNVTRATGYSANGPYHIPDAWLDGYTIYTNLPYSTAYRGFGHVEFSWGLERHMDLCAQTMGIDPYEFRKLNMYKPGSTTITGEEITADSGNVRKCVETVKEAIGYGTLTAEEKQIEAKGKKIGKAMVTFKKAPAMPAFTGSTTTIRMNEDGTVNANLTLTEIGQGAYTAIAQIVAERLRIPYDDVNVTIYCDTEHDPYDWQTVASKGLFMSGNASIKAADDLLERVYKVASEVLRCDVIDLDHQDGKVFIKHHPKSFVTFAQVAVGYAYPNGNGVGGPILGVGSYIAQGLTNLEKTTGQGYPALDWTMGAHGVIVEADPESGEYTIKKIATAMDLGKVINLGCAKGQTFGAVVQGMGTGVCEGYIYDDQGKLMNPNFTDNKIPTSKDVPESLEFYPIETPQIDGPYGARGIGEPPMVSVASGIGNALKDALGVELLNLPIRSEDVWRAIADKENFNLKDYVTKK